MSDSQVTLHWTNNQKEPLKQWVRNKVVEINRLTQPKDWMFVRNEDMIADIGTRRIPDFHVVGKDSVWINGFDWIKWHPFQQRQLMRSSSTVKRYQHWKMKF